MKKITETGSALPAGRREIIDAETGHKERVVVYTRNKVPVSNWGIIMQDALRDMTLKRRELELNMTDIAVRDIIISDAGLGNKISINQSAMSRDLQIAQPNISASIKKLEKIGFLIPVFTRDGSIAKDGSRKIYEVNAELFFKGSLGNNGSYIAALRRQQKQRQEELTRRQLVLVGVVGEENSEKSENPVKPAKNPKNPKKAKSKGSSEEAQQFLGFTIDPEEAAEIDAFIESGLIEQEKAKRERKD